MRFALLLLLVGTIFAEETIEDLRRRADDALAENTRQLHEAFRARDATRESHLYAQRREILVRRRDLRPPSSKPPTVHRGFVEGFQASRLTLRRDDGFHEQLWVGQVYKREIREAYLALEAGDEVELIFTDQPDPLSDERYRMELTGVRHIGSGEKQVETLSIERNFRKEASLLRVAGHRARATTYLAVIRNMSRDEWKLGEGDGVKVRATNLGDVEEEIPASVSGARNLLPGEVLCLQIEVAPLSSQVRFLGLTVLAPDNSTLVSAYFPLDRKAD